MITVGRTLMSYETPAVTVRIQSSSTSAPGLTTQDSDAMCSQSVSVSSGRSSICQPKFAVSLKWKV